MWISEERTKKTAGKAAAEWGVVTVAGQAAVYLEAERRNVALCCPGGFAWHPAAGEEVLVLKTGAEGERPYILGVTKPEVLLPGQVRVGSKDCGILCGEDLELTGKITVNGENLEDLISRLAKQAAAESSGEEG